MAFQYKNILRSILCLLIGIPMTAFAQTNSPSTTNPCVGSQGKLKLYYWNEVEQTDIRHLHTHAAFPQAPDGILTLVESATGSRFNDYYASVMKGFFTVPETGEYQFNVTANDKAQVFISPDDDPANMQLEMNVVDDTGQTNHYNFPDQQLSQLKTLTAEQYYYFEIHHKEAKGNDYVGLHWHTPTMADSTWQTLPVNHIYEYLCDELCPPAGTVCDDGNPDSTDDKEDGYCNCFGQQESLLGCVGEQGKVQVLNWFNVPGSELDNLYNLPTYPLVPDHVEFLGLFGHFSQFNTSPESDYLGKVAKAYLSVPQSGDYIFNVTGDDRVKLFLSPDEEPLNAVEIANNVGSNEIFEYDEYAEQTSAPTYLTAGQYYYIELHFKENTSTSHYYVYWKTPFSTYNDWQVLPLRYLYNYECETACLPNGTICDDKDSTTTNDIITDCACAGTPCPEGDCTEIETYVPYEACDYTDQHSNTPNNSWISCVPSQSPNPARGESHWVSFDFGNVFQLNNINLWNYNVFGSTAMGFKDVVIDYSIDGVNWIEAGAFQVPQASGTNDYAGLMSSALNGVGARYVLITALSNWGNISCAGLSEISFDAETCPDKGTPCDDGDPNTTDDMYDIYCQCRGLGEPINTCTVDSIYLESSRKVEEGSNVNFIAGIAVELKPQFEVALGANFLAAIDPCTAVPVSGRMSGDLVDEDKEEVNFKLHSDPGTRDIYVKFTKKTMDALWLTITDAQGNAIVHTNQNELKGSFEQKFNLFSTTGRIFNVRIEANGAVYQKRLLF